MVRRLMILVLALTLIGTSVSAETWNVDVVHSSVSFSVKHLVISTVTGKFNKFSGVIDWDGKSPVAGGVEFSIEMASVDTDNEKRDGHLTSPDFFDAEKFPTLTFKSTKVIPGEDGNFKLVGDMTMKEITKSVTFDAHFNGAMDFMGTTKAGFSVTGEIDRQDFGVTWSQTLDGGGLMLSDVVKINLELEVSKFVPETEEETKEADKSEKTDE